MIDIDRQIKIAIDEIKAEDNIGVPLRRGMRKIPHTQVETFILL